MQFKAVFLVLFLIISNTCVGATRSNESCENKLKTSPEYKLALQKAKDNFEYYAPAVDGQLREERYQLKTVVSAIQNIRALIGPAILAKAINMHLESIGIKWPTDINNYFKLVQARGLSEDEMVQFVDKIYKNLKDILPVFEHNDGARVQYINAIRAEFNLSPEAYIQISELLHLKDSHKVRNVRLAVLDAIFDPSIEFRKHITENSFTFSAFKRELQKPKNKKKILGLLVAATLAYHSVQAGIEHFITEPESLAQRRLELDPYKQFPRSVFLDDRISIFLSQNRGINGYSQIEAYNEGIHDFAMAHISELNVRQVIALVTTINVVHFNQYLDEPYYEFIDEILVQYASENRDVLTQDQFRQLINAVPENCRTSDLDLCDTGQKIAEIMAEELEEAAELSSQ